MEYALLIMLVIMIYLYLQADGNYRCEKLRNEKLSLSRRKDGIL